MGGVASGRFDVWPVLRGDDFDSLISHAAPLALTLRNFEVVKHEVEVILFKSNGTIRYIDVR